jgi:hypothetical protein
MSKDISVNLMLPDCFLECREGIHSTRSRKPAAPQKQSIWNQ